ncbi:MAG TPA: hypothetical protein VIK91_08845 [Nannocystis sp.]
MQRELKALHKGYDHARSPYLALPLVLAGLADADRRCDDLLRIAGANGNAYDNPTTRFHELLCALRSRACPDAPR